MSALFDSIADVMSQRFNLDRGAIVPGATFEQLGLDSLSQIELATALEKKLGLKISDDEISEMSTVAELVGVLERRNGTG